MSTSHAFSEIVAELETGGESDVVYRGLQALLSGAWTPAQVAGFLIGLRVRGHTAATVVAGARALREAMIPLRHHFGSAAIDTCGTGGDGSNTVNLSTGAALIAAAAGVPVAKHGNRAASSRCGSADVLDELGVRTALSADAAARVFEEVNITFLFAPVFHPAMRFVAPVRRELGVRTLFNCLGPLANPAGVTRQVVGAYEDSLRPVLGEALLRLGVERAWVVHSADGLDELSPFGPTAVTEVTRAGLKELSVTPQDFGLGSSESGAIAGGDAKQNADILRQVLGRADHPARNAFLLNAAAALVVARGLEFRAAGELARSVVESGQALAKLEAWRAATERHAPPAT